MQAVVKTVLNFGLLLKVTNLLTNVPRIILMYGVCKDRFVPCVSLNNLAIKTWGSEGVQPHIINLRTTGKLLISLKTPRLNYRGNNPSVSRQQAVFWILEKVWVPLLSRIAPWFVDRPARNLVTVLTELPRIA